MEHPFLETNSLTDKIGQKHRLNFPQGISNLLSYPISIPGERVRFCATLKMKAKKDGSSVHYKQGRRSLKKSPDPCSAKAGEHSHTFVPELMCGQNSVQFTRPTSA